MVGYIEICFSVYTFLEGELQVDIALENSQIFLSIKIIQNTW